MARVFTDGAEFGDALFWDYIYYGVTAVTAKKRSGNYSYGGAYYTNKNLINPLSEFYLRFAFYSDGLGSYILWWNANGTTRLGGLTINSGTLIMTAEVSTTPVATSIHSIANSIWHLLEVHVLIADAGAIEVLVDGISEIDYHGDTKPGSDTTSNLLGFNYGNYTYFDDIALNDTTGGVDDSWCGDGHIELLTPVTGGTYQWTGSDGDSVDNYAMVDDIPATGDDYVKDSTAGHQDIYSLSDFTGTGKIIQRVWPECRAKDNDNSGGQIKLGMKSGGTTHLGSAISLPGNYGRIVGDDEKVNPDDSGAWEDADLDALQFVVECE